MIDIILKLNHYYIIVLIYDFNYKIQILLLIKLYYKKNYKYKKIN